MIKIYSAKNQATLISTTQARDSIHLRTQKANLTKLAHIEWMQLFCSRPSECHDKMEFIM